jgi:hypothetical protein
MMQAGFDEFFLMQGHLRGETSTLCGQEQVEADLQGCLPLEGCQAGTFLILVAFFCVLT